MVTCSQRLLDLWEISDESFEVLACSVKAPPLAHSEGGLPRMLGDPLIARPTFAETWSVDVDLAPDAIWPWLSQMMRGGGVYGWPRLDGPLSRPSRLLLPGARAARVGDRVANLLELCTIGVGAEVVWRNVRELELLGCRISGLTLDYKVSPLPSGGSRLEARIRCVISGVSRPISAHVAKILSYILPGHQLLTLVECATAPRQRDPAASSRPEAEPHYQHAAFVPAEGA